MRGPPSPSKPVRPNLLMGPTKAGLPAHPPLPSPDQRGILSANLLKWLNNDVKHPYEVAREFPTDTALRRLAGAPLENHADRQRDANRPHITNGSMPKTCPERNDEARVAEPARAHIDRPSPGDHDPEPTLSLNTTAPRVTTCDKATRYRTAQHL